MLTPSISPQSRESRWESVSPIGQRCDGEAWAGALHQSRHWQSRLNATPCLSERRHTLPRIDHRSGGVRRFRGPGAPPLLVATWPQAAVLDHRHCDVVVSEWPTSRELVASPETGIVVGEAHHCPRLIGESQRAVFWVVVFLTTA
jgi:hypothetical protein